MDATLKRPAANKVEAVSSGIWHMIDTVYARRAADVDIDALELALRAVVDTLACIAGGTREPATLAACRASGLSSAEARALVLGTASHALDYDDVCMLATCHPSAPVFSTLLASLDELQPSTSLAELLTAHLVGTEVMLRLGAWLGFGHYALGFHATSTLGVIGATVACSHIKRFPSTTMHAAVSIAASSASGLRANFGTDTKPLHVGFAASAAVRAVRLAEAGASASRDALAGFSRAFSGGAELQPLPFYPSQPWAIQEPGFEVKRYPSCYMTHRLIAGVHRLRERRAETEGSGEVTISVLFPHGGTAPLKYAHPRTGLEAKFSAPYCAAAAWHDGRINLATFSDEACARPSVVKTMAGVVARERDGPHEPLGSAPVEVTIIGHGWQDRIVVDWAPGSLQDPLSAEELLDKWVDCALHGGLPSPNESAAALLRSEHDQFVMPLLMPLRSEILVHAASPT